MIHLFCINTKIRINMPVLVIDCETTGLPRLKKNRTYYPPHKFKNYNTSRIVELGYALYSKIDGDWVVTKEMSFLVCPDGFAIANSHIHGIEHHHACLNGLPIKAVLESFKKDLDKVKKVVAYNAAFDSNILLSEAHRCGYQELCDAWKTKSIICAMELAKNKLKRKRGFKLINVYNELYSTNLKQEHRAASDIKLCSAVFFKLMTQSVSYNSSDSSSSSSLVREKK